tara:strand:+ start:180 stop:368 length:189 start_codon:yes stop_codon:yes gene_type:complete
MRNREEMKRLSEIIQSENILKFVRGINKSFDYDLLEVLKEYDDLKNLEHRQLMKIILRSIDL